LVTKILLFVSEITPNHGKSSTDHRYGPLVYIVPGESPLDPIDLEKSKGRQRLAGLVPKSFFTKYP
jgi:hypothetical protein